MLTHVSLLLALKSFCFRSEFSGEVSYWSLYDAFMEAEQAEREREAGEQDQVPGVL